MKDVYNVTCEHCGRVWEPESGSRLWKKAKYMQSRHKTATASRADCGCELLPEKEDSGAFYRLEGRDENGNVFSIPFMRVTELLSKYFSLLNQGVDVSFVCSSEQIKRRVEEMRKKYFNIVD